MDYGINLKFNNNEVANGLEKTAVGFDDLVEATASFEKETKKASVTAAKELTNVQSETKKTVSEIQKAGKAITDSFKAKQADIAAVAIELSKNSKASEQLAAMLKKVDQAKLNGVVLDLQAMEDEFTKVLENVELTDNQIKILTDNIGEVAAEIAKIKAQPFTDLQNEMKDMPKTLDLFGRELRDLTNTDIEKLEEKIKQLALSGQQNTDEFKNAAQELGAYKARLLEADRAVEIYAKSTDALTGALGEYEDRLYDLRLANKQNTAEYKELLDKVIQMKSAIINVDAEVDAFVEKRNGFASVLQSVELLGAGFQIAEGFAAAFGSENEDMQKVLVKLNAIMAITSALEQARTILLEQQRQKTGAAAAAQAIYTTVVGTSSGALKVFRLALAATGIGLIVLVLASVVANWDKVTKSVNNSIGGMIDFGKVLNGVRAVLDGVFEALSVVYEYWEKIFNRDFSGAFDTVVNGFDRVTQASKKTYDQLNQNDLNKELAKQLQKQVDFNTKKADILEAGGKDATAIRRKNLQDEIKVLQLQKEEESKIQDKIHELNVFDAERQKELDDKRKEEAEKAAEKRKALIENFKKELESLNDEEKKLREQNILNAIKDNVERLQKQQEFDKADIELKRKATLEQFKELKKKTEINTIFDAILLENQKKYSQLFLDEQKKLADERAAKAREQARLVLEAEEEVLNATIEGGKLSNDQIRAIELQRLEIKKKSLQDELEAIRLKYGYESNEAFLAMEKISTITAQIDKKTLDNQIKSLDEANKLRVEYIDIELQNELLSFEKRKQLEQEKLGIILASLEAQRALLGNVQTEESINLDKQIRAAKLAISNFNSQLKPAFQDAGDLFKSFLQSAFGADEELSGQLVAGFGQLKSAVLDAVNAGYEAELATIQGSIDARKEKIDELTSLIEEEEQRKKDGYANDYDALVAAKANEEQLLKAEQKKATDLKKEQLKQDAVIQTTQQAGALATAVANIIKDSSKFGIVGIFTGIAAIVSMFAIWKRYKSQASALSQQAYKGGLISDYLKPGVKGQSDRPGYGKGHKVEGTNLSIGADEFLMSSGPTKRHLPFLREMNSGKFDDFDLSELFNKRAPIYNKGRVVRIVEGYDDMRRERKRAQDAAIMGRVYESTLKSVIQEQTKALIGDNERRPTVIQMPDGSVEVIYYEKSGTKKRRIKP